MAIVHGGLCVVPNGLEAQMLHCHRAGGVHACSEELKTLIAETPKERRLQKKLNPQMVKSALKGRGRAIGNRFMIKHALADFSPELYEGLQTDLKKKSRLEVMQRLRPTGASKTKQQKIDKKKNAKNRIAFKKVASYQNQTWPK